MREIKFRAYSKYCGMMYNVTKIDFEKRSFEISEGHIGYARYDPQFMQFTGLKDKNGKEIYEGDILQWTDGDMWEGAVEWSEGDCGFYTNPTLNGLDSIRCGQYSVIGNIYENPELTGEPDLPIKSNRV